MPNENQPPAAPVVEQPPVAPAVPSLLSEPAPAPAAPVAPAAPAAPAPGSPPAGDPAPAPAAPAAAPAAKWSDTWREELVGDVTTEEGKKKLAQLQRLDSPRALYEKVMNQEKLISSGAYKKALPEGASAEELAAYREEHGVPATHDKYDQTLPDGMVLGEDDKPLVEEFLKDMHLANAPQAQVTAALGAYAKIVQAAEADRALKDKDVIASTTTALRAEWGAEYQANLNLVKGFIATAPEAVQGQILNARLADGTPLASHPDVLRWFAGNARTLNPMGTIVPGSADPTGAVETELAGLKKMMGDDTSEYWKGPNADKNQARYRELLTFQERVRK